MELININMYFTDDSGKYTGRFGDILWDQLESRVAAAIRVPLGDRFMAHSINSSIVNIMQ